MADLWNHPREVLEDVDHRRRLKWVIKQVKNPELVADKVAYLYAHPDAISRDELELINGKFLDRYTAPVISHDGKYFGSIWAYRDITERKRAEEKNSEQAALLDEAQDAIFVRDLDHRMTTGTRVPNGFMDGILKRLWAGIYMISFIQIPTSGN